MEFILAEDMSDVLAAALEDLPTPATTAAERSASSGVSA
jgi:hypothetical protein